MIFPAESMIEERDRLIGELQAGRTTEQAVFERLLELDPDDGFALERLGTLRQNAGDFVEAERFFWRSAEADPTRPQPFLWLRYLPSLADTLFSDGLMELALRKLLLDEEAFKEFRRAVKPPSDIKRFDRRAAEQAVAGLLAKRTLEPGAVADRLRPHRLIHELQEREERLEKELVDRIVEHGEECSPLLEGMLRAWAAGEISDSQGARCLALLGEIGDPDPLPELFECALAEPEEVNAAASWAIDRIAERRPGEALAVFRRLAEEGDGAAVLVLIQHTTIMPAVAGRFELQESLLERLKDVPEEARDTAFLASMVGLEREGPRGRAAALSAVSRYGALADPRILREARSRLASPASFEFDPPKLSSIYEVCRGEDWFKDEDEDEEAVPPLPPKRPGRNDPCWCGSGKKYKRCHLRQDEQPQQPPELELRDRVVRFLMDSLGPEDLDRASAIYFGPYYDPSEPPDDPEKFALLDWMLYDYSLPRFGRTAMEEYLARNRPRLPPEECELLEAWTKGRVSLYEVQEVQRDVGMRLKDLLRGGELFVHEVSGSRVNVRWDCILARVLEERGRNVFSGVAMQVPLQHCRELKEWIAAEQRASGLEMPEFLHANSHRLKQKTYEMAEQAMRSLKMVSPEGDEVTPSKAIYDLKDRDRVLSALRGCDELDEDRDETGAIFFAWTEPKPDESARRSLGSVRLERLRLTLECMTRQRLARGKKLLARLAGRSLKHRADEFTPLEKAMREAKSAPRPRQPEIPPEVEREIVGKFLEDHYAKWPDVPLPALDGQTPRQAVQTPEGRARVAELLKQFENGEERNRQEGRAWYDVSRLRAALGLERG